MDEKQRKELMEAMHSLYIDQDYADLTIKCSEQTFRVHKAIICPRSEFFKNCCKEGFKEGASGEIDLDEDDPQIVQFMLHYLYHLDYPRVGSSSSTVPGGKQGKPSIEAMSPPNSEGSSQQAPSSSDTASSTAKPRAGGLFMSSQGSKSPGPQRTAGQHEKSQYPSPSNLLLHAKMYAIGDKYRIAGLKALALEKFHKESKATGFKTDFSQAAREAYSSTPDSDRALRDLVVQTIVDFHYLLDQEELQSFVRDSPLAFDLVMALHRKRQPQSVFAPSSQTAAPSRNLFGGISSPSPASSGNNNSQPPRFGFGSSQN